MAYYRIAYKGDTGLTSEFEIIANNDDDAADQLKAMCSIFEVISVTVID